MAIGDAVGAPLEAGLVGCTDVTLRADTRFDVFYRSLICTSHLRKTPRIITRVVGTVPDL